MKKIRSGNNRNSKSSSKRKINVLKISKRRRKNGKKFTLKHKGGGPDYDFKEIIPMCDIFIRFIESKPETTEENKDQIINLVKDQLKNIFQQSEEGFFVDSILNEEGLRITNDNPPNEVKTNDLSEKMFEKNIYHENPNPDENKVLYSESFTYQLLKYLKTKIYSLDLLKIDLKSLVKYLNEPDGETKIVETIIPNIDSLEKKKFSNFTSIGYDKTPYYFFQILYKIIKTIYIEIIKIAYNNNTTIQTKKIEENPLLNGLRSFLDSNKEILTKANLTQTLQRIKTRMTPPSTPLSSPPLLPPPPPPNFLNDCIKIDVKDYDLQTTEINTINICLYPIELTQDIIELSKLEEFTVKLANLKQYKCYENFLLDSDNNYDISIIKDSTSSDNNDYIIDNSLDENEIDKKVKLELEEVTKENLIEKLKSEFIENPLYLISKSDKNLSFPVIFANPSSN
jgi:hypothetical protein